MKPKGAANEYGIYTENPGYEFPGNTRSLFVEARAAVSHIILNRQSLFE
jgi:hypothetical protein